MATTPVVSYVNRDFATILQALKVHVQTRFGSTWKDFYESNLGVALMEMTAYCLTGDTEIPLLDGSKRRIEDLVDGGEFWVYAWDAEQQRIVPARAVARKTRENAELVKVTLDNEISVRCTPNHLFLMRDGTYRPAAQLKSGNSLLPLYRRVCHFSKQKMGALADNHKVLSVEPIPDREDVYDLTVIDGPPNFAIAAGIFVHNCFDILSFYLNYAANESFLPTARDRESIVNLCRLIGYGLRPATAAAVTCTATIDAVEAVDIIIEAGTTVQSSTGVTFTFLTDQRIPAGAVTASVVCSEGVISTANFTGDGTAFQKFLLPTPEVVEGSISVTVNGEAWTKIDSLVYGNESSKYYAVSYDADDYATLETGDGTSGMMPPLGASVVVQYRVGGGVQGNIALNEIKTDISGLRDGSAPPSYATVHLANDTERGSGGEPRETAEHARFWAPLWVKTNGRAVTKDDFTTLATAFVDPTYGSVAYAQAHLKQDVPELNTVVLSVWGRDSYGDITLCSLGLKNALYTYFMNDDAGAVRTICTDVEVEDGNIAYVDTALAIKVASNYATADVTSRVTQAITDFFNSTNVRPGWDFRLSQFYSAIQAVVGVEYALIDEISASYKTTETVDVGDGATANYSGSLAITSGQPIAPHSVVITAGAYRVTDDGEGNLIGDIAAGTNTINYDTGVYNVTFSGNVALGDYVEVEYRYYLTYQRGDLEQTFDGTTATASGTVSYPPVVPSSFALSDGAQVATDDGSGTLTGDVASGTIDYDTGAYTLTWNAVPGAGSELRSTYRQLLKTASEDLPMDDDQLAVKSLVTVRTLTE